MTSLSMPHSSQSVPRLTPPRPHLELPSPQLYLGDGYPLPKTQFKALCLQEDFPDNCSSLSLSVMNLKNNDGLQPESHP